MVLRDPKDTSPAAAVETPCTGVCSVDPACGLCRGCARTLDEIARWLSLSAAERRAIMAALPERRAGAAPRPLRAKSA